MTDYRNIEERCVLCLDAKRYPVSIQCGHSFCMGCLNVYKSYKKYPWANKCPICREVIQREKKPVKHKHSGSTSGTYSDTINTSSASLTSTATQRDNSLENFISMAAYYLDDNRDENDIYFDSYVEVDVDDSAQDLTVSDTNLSTSYSQADPENSYEEVSQYLTDSEDYNDNFGDGDDGNEGTYGYYDEDDEYFYEPANNDSYIDDYLMDDSEQDDDSMLMNSVDDNDTEIYHIEDSEEDGASLVIDLVGGNHDIDNSEENDDGQAITLVRVNNDSVMHDINRFDIDWEAVIASDIIIAD